MSKYRKAKNSVSLEDDSLAQARDLISILAPVNRPRTVEPETRNFLYNLYVFLWRQAGLTTYIKQRTFEAAADSAEAWKIIAISLNALRHLAIENTPKGLKRGHAVDRSIRAQVLFESKEPLSERVLISEFFAHDTVALITAKENGKNGVSDWSPLFEVPNGIFDSNSYSVCYRVKTEKAWVKETLKRIHTNELQPFWTSDKLDHVDMQCEQCHVTGAPLTPAPSR